MIPTMYSVPLQNHVYFVCHWHFQVYTGSYRPKSGVVQSGADISTLSANQLVAVQCENCELEPLIARVEGIKQDDVEIVWLEGKYNKSWKVAKHLDPKNRRKKVDWKDVVPKSSIILFDFKLTASNHLRKSTVEHLKKAYLELKQNN